MSDSWAWRLGPESVDEADTDSWEIGLLHSVHSLPTFVTLTLPPFFL